MFERTIIGRVVALILQDVVIAGEVGEHVIVRIHVGGGGGDWCWRRALSWVGSCGRSPLVGEEVLGCRG